MIKFRKTLGVCAAAMIATGGLAGAASADEALEKAVKARQSVMQIYAFYLGKLGAMAKGEAEYDAEMATTFATNLQTVAGMNNGAMWPAGSGLDNPDLAGKTAAKPEIWSTYPEIAEKSKALTTAAAELAAVAGDGQEALGGAMKPVGMACGGCHKPFRQKDD